MGLKVLLLLCLAVINCTHAFHHFIPANKELIYDYTGYMAAVTHDPKEDHASRFAIDGKMHMTTDGKAVMMRLMDLKMRMDNGHMYDVLDTDDVTELPLPAELKTLEMPFKIMHDEHGMTSEMEVTTDEPEYVVNMKKAIGGIMQMNMKVMDCVKEGKPCGFSSDEDSMYGMTKYFYNVRCMGDDVIMVDKMMEANSSAHMYNHMITNSKIDERCFAKEGHIEESLTHDSQRLFKFKKMPEGYVMEEIAGKGGMYYHPFRGHSFAYYIWANQSFMLESMQDVKTDFKMANSKMIKDMYYTWDHKPTDVFADLTHGRRTWDMAKLKSEVETMIKDMVMYMKENHLNTETPDIIKGQRINQVIRLLMYMDMPTMQKMCEELMQDKETMWVFYRLLPMIGTRASMMHMKNMIKQKKLKDSAAVKMMQMMSFYVKVPDMTMLTEMEDLMRLGDDYSPMVRRAGVLGFANLMNAALHRHGLKSKDTFYFKDESHKYPSEEDLEKYMEEFEKKMMSSTTMSDKIMYMQAMHNTGMESTMKYLMPILKEDKDYFMRLLAAIALSPTVLKDEDMTFDTYWPVMTDEKAPLSLRLTAYYLMMEAMPTMSRMENIFSYMENVDSYEMYEFHYKFVEAMTKTTDPCMMQFAMQCKQVFRYMPKPEFNSINGYHQMDYRNMKYGFGQMFNWLFIKEDDEMIFKMGTGVTYDGFSKLPYSMFMRIKGLTPMMMQDLKFTLDSTTNILDTQKLIDAYKTLSSNKDIEITIMVACYEQITMTYHLTHDNLKDLTEFMGMFDQTFNYAKEFLDIHYTTSVTTFFPTEMGFPAVFQLYFPVMTYTNFKINKDTKTNIVTYHIEGMYKMWMHGRCGLSFYNPVTDVWQGVNRYTSIDTMMPVNLDLSINMQTHSMKMSWKRFDKREDNMAGMRSHATTMTFIRDDDMDMLSKCCKECKHFEMATWDDDKKMNYTWMNREDPNLGMQLFATTYDNEMYISEGLFTRMMKLPRIMNYKTTFDYYMLLGMQFFSLMKLQPHGKTTGVLLRMEPSKQFDVTSNDLTLRFTRTYTPNEEMPMRMGMDYSIRATYALKSGEKTLRTWDMTFNMNWNKGQTVRNTKMQITRMIPDQKDYKMCFTDMKEFSETGTTGTFEMATTQSAEGGCGKDEVVLSIKSKGEMMEAQKMGKHNYWTCDMKTWSDMIHRRPYECYAAYSTLRKYTYHIKTRDFPKEYMKMMRNWFEHFQQTHMTYYKSMDTTGETLGENEMKVILKYPMQAKVIDLEILTHDHDCKFTGLPNTMDYIFMPDNMHFTKMMRWMHMTGMTKHCTISENSVDTFKNTMMDMTMTPEYTMMVGNAEKDATYGLWVKKMKDCDKIAVKVMTGDKTIEMMPESCDSRHHKMMIDGTEVTKMPVNEKMFHLNHVEEDEMCSLVMHKMGCHILYDTEFVQIETPKMEGKYFGPCTGH